MKGLVVLSIAVAALMLFPPTSAVVPSPAALRPAALPSAPTTVAAHATTTSSATSASEKVLAAIKAAGVPTRDVFLPNLGARPTVSNGVVQPLYSAAPSPMGLGYFGVKDVHGVNVGTVSYTQSVEATVQMNSVTPFYLASSSPDIFTMQLNTVATNVDVLGTPGEYWIQNVPIYEADSQTLAIEDNIWNFSSPTAGMQVNTLYSYDGNLIAPEFYYAEGPTWHMPTPFTIDLYNNATVLNDRPTIFFNYTILAANGSVYSGSYDQVEFNSAVNPTSPSPTPTYQIDGKQTNPLGLLNDAEIMLGGPGGGSTTTLLGINARMALATLPNGTSTYVPVPAGFSSGTDTGETSEGIAEYATGSLSNPWAVLGPGPSLLQPLWGLVGAHFGKITTTVTVSPANAFVFVSTSGTFKSNSAAWAPTPESGTLTIALPPGTYSYKFLLSDYAPTSAVVSGSSSFAVSLASDPALGVYTPLYAWTNAELAGISQPGGLGTSSHPYVLENREYGTLNPLFGEFNDYMFGVFSGIFIADTTAHVDVYDAPSFAIAYSLAPEASSTTQFGTPATNNLGMQFYNVSNLALVATPVITGWFFADAGSYMSNVLFWNSSDNLIAANDFEVESTGIILFGGTGNVLWGNVFTPATTAAPDPSSIYFGSTPLAIEEFNAADLIYNNAVLTPYTAYTPGYNLYTGAFNIPVDTWNVRVQPASDVRHMLGFDLTGSILGTSWIGGNYWGNYGTASNPYGVLPYDDSGLIFVGGDHAPLINFALYKVTFQEKGLAKGTAWWVDINGYNQTVTSQKIVFWEPAGTYAFTTGSTGLTATPSVGGFTVSTSPVTEKVSFS